MKNFAVGCVVLAVLGFAVIAIVGRQGSRPAPPPAAPLQVGATLSLRSHTVRLRGVKVGFVSPNQFDRPAAGNEYVVVAVTARNTGTNDLPVNCFGFTLEDDAGVERQVALLGGLEQQLESVTLKPGGELAGRIAFEARKSSKRLVLHYRGGLLDKAGRWQLR